MFARCSLQPSCTSGNNLLGASDDSARFQEWPRHSGGQAAMQISSLATIRGSTTRYCLTPTAPTHQQVVFAVLPRLGSVLQAVDHTKCPPQSDCASPTASISTYGRSSIP